MSLTVIRDLVFQECGADANIFGPAFFEQHVAVVAGYALELAARLGADPEAVELAAYLHDLAAIRDGSVIAEHARLGAELATRILQDQEYPADLIQRVARAIASHSKPVARGSGTLEEVCVSNADAMAQIARPAYWLYYAFSVRKRGFEEGRAWLLGHYEGNWKALIPEARELARDRYEIALNLLRMEPSAVAAS